MSQCMLLREVRCVCVHTRVEAYLADEEPAVTESKAAAENLGRLSSEWQ